MDSVQTKLIECPNPDCKQPVMVTLPGAHVVNMPMVSSIMLIHQFPDECPACHLQLTPKVVSLDKGFINIAWVPVQIEKKSGLVVAPAGLDVKGGIPS